MTNHAMRFFVYVYLSAPSRFLFAGSWGLFHPITETAATMPAAATALVHQLVPSPQLSQGGQCGLPNQR